MRMSSLTDGISDVKSVSDGECKRIHGWRPHDVYKTGKHTSANTQNQNNKQYKADLQSRDFSSYRLFMKLFRTSSTDVVQECRNYLGIELPSCLIKKSFCHGLTVWTICFVDCKLWFFCAAVQRINFFSLFLLPIIVYHWCWWIKLKTMAWTYFYWIIRKFPVTCFWYKR